MKSAAKPVLNESLLGGFLAATMISIVTLAVAACGVRGNPEPPLTPAELGRGQPSFKRSSDEFVFPSPTPAPNGKASSSGE